ncbi:MAG: biopolymer transporter ExbD [Myxococcales bacterium]|nr:biopolymer transporter ExbD [Myxococcales bacterium]MDD9970721.1 biopolymer transporter ExbD [Myxococcales bacterium]
MPIHRPGTVLLKNVPLQFVANQRKGHGRSVNTEVTLVPFIDLLITLVVFLLMSFSASGELLAQNPSIVLPDASVSTDIEIAPVISIDATVITLDGRRIADVPTLAADPKVARIEALISDLDTLKRNWAILHPRDPFAGTVIIQADKNVDYRVIKKVLYSAGQSGYPNISYAVNRVGD